MDNRIANDMISSGMIPSGEKKKEDLSRTQYGSAPSPSKLMDAYKSMYEHHKKDADGNTIPHEGEELNEGKIPAGLQAYLDKKKGKKEDKKEVKEENVDEALVTGTLAALKLLGTKAAKLGVQMAAKSKIPGATNVVKSVARNPMGAIDNINRVGYAAQTVGNLVPKGVPAVTKKQSQGGMISADADLFDIVKGKLLDEGYNEREVNEIMVNLTEEQLDEFLKALAQAGMRGAESVGKATRGLAARAAQQGANIGKRPSEMVDVVSPTKSFRKPFEPKSKTNAPTASDVVNAAAAMRRTKPVNKPVEPEKISRRKGEVMQDNADLFDIVKGQLLDEGMSEEEIRDIMLTLTPDEIMKEMNQGPSTPVRIDDVEKGDGTKTKRVMHNLGAGRKGQIRPKPGFKMNPVTNDPVKEEYKNFDPKKPDPKQVAVQAKQEKNRQKFNDPMGVKNTNIGGQGLDPMDK